MGGRVDVDLEVERDLGVRRERDHFAVAPRERPASSEQREDAMHVLHAMGRVRVAAHLLDCGAPRREIVAARAEPRAYVREHARSRFEPEIGVFPQRELRRVRERSTARE